MLRTALTARGIDWHPRNEGGNAAGQAGRCGGVMAYGGLKETE